MCGKVNTYRRRAGSSVLESIGGFVVVLVVISIIANLAKNSKKRSAPERSPTPQVSFHQE